MIRSSFGQSRSEGKLGEQEMQVTVTVTKSGSITLSSATELERLKDVLMYSLLNQNASAETNAQSQAIVDAINAAS